MCWLVWVDNSESSVRSNNSGWQGRLSIVYLSGSAKDGLSFFRARYDSLDKS